MNRAEEYLQAIPHLFCLDLSKDFRSCYLGDSGEVTVSSNFEHPLYLKVGTAVLSVTHLLNRTETTDSSSSYVVRHETHDATCKPAMLIDELDKLNDLEYDEEVPADFERVIGRFHPIGLDLPTNVSRRQFEIRIGNTLNKATNYLSFKDLDSLNGTQLYIAKTDAPQIVTPLKRFSHRSKYSSKTAPEAIGKWLRLEDDYKQAARKGFR